MKYSIMTGFYEELYKTDSLYCAMLEYNSFQDEAHFNEESNLFGESIKLYCTDTGNFLVPVEYPIFSNNEINKAQDLNL